MPDKPLIAPTAPTTEPVDKKRTADQEAGNAQSTSPKTKSLDGVTSIDDKVFLECEILAYAALSKIAAQVAEEVKEPIGITTPPANPVPTVILLDDTLVSALQLY